MHLALVDTAGIQPFIFGSNRLRENIGASYLVAQATGPWVLEAVAAEVARHNVANGELDPNAPSLLQAPDALDAEVLYTGGGNAVVLFAHDADCARFVYRLTRRALKEVPGMHLVVETHPFDPRKESLAETDRGLRRALAVAKRAAPPVPPLLGVAVDVPCASTGTPATAEERPGSQAKALPLAPEVQVKWKAARANGPADHRLHQTLRFDALTLDDGTPLSRRFVLPRGFDDLGRSYGEHSYLGVVHADGNAMGERIKALANQHPSDSAAYAGALRTFANRLRAAATHALCDTVQHLARNVDLECGRIVHPNAQAAERVPAVNLQKVDDKGRWYLPFRPIVFGGDDLTFVCDGRLALPLTTFYLERFEHHTAELLPEGRATARAGVALVKAHYPFARAYALAEELAASAKALRKAPPYQDASSLDWYIAEGGLAGPLDRMRKREYQIGDRSLHQRPVALHAVPAHGAAALQQWPTVRAALEAFQQDTWLGRRNKLKALREHLRRGPDAVKRFTDAYLAGAGTLPDLDRGPDLRKQGYLDDRCGYYDALELADHFIPLSR